MPASAQRSNKRERQPVATPAKSKKRGGSKTTKNKSDTSAGGKKTPEGSKNNAAADGNGSAQNPFLSPGGQNPFQAFGLPQSMSPPQGATIINHYHIHYVLPGASVQ